MNRTELLPDRPGIPPMAKLPDPEVIDPEALASAYASGEIDLICVVGPTASGKTRYAVQLAKAFGNAEILSADSRQVYRGMDIGTGKDLCEYDDVPYHLIDIVPAGAKFNIYQYQAAFADAWAAVRSKGAIPILCGGSGLYIEAADRRLEERLKEGLVEEVRGLLETVPAPDLIYYGLEYKFVTQYVLGELSYDDMVVGLGNAIHQFAKRQMTWFRGMERDGIRIHWTRP